MEERAWASQSKSLVDVQKQGSGLEKLVRDVVKWSGGRVTYDPANGYQIQVDSVYPSVDRPETIISVTYTNPDTRGHSNENKFHLKVGELALLKNAYPKLKIVLAIGGSKETWLPYVLQAFQIFYDEVIFLWQETGRKRLQDIARNPAAIKLRNNGLWTNMRTAWQSRKLASALPPSGLLRYKVLDDFKTQSPTVHHPSLITNEIARLCMQRSRDSSGAEWDSYLARRWNSIEMSRNYFNPNEAAVELALMSANLKYEGGVARDIEVRSLLHDLGMTGTRLSEDFILTSRRLNCPVYIQCKASGGGRTQHGKNIQNRTKEQITRSILYSCRSKGGHNIDWHEKDFHWIGVVDGDWGVTKRQPLKYIHMLQLAGYDKIICAEDLVDTKLSVKKKKNPLLTYLTETLDCATN